VGSSTDVMLCYEELWVSQKNNGTSSGTLSQTLNLKILPQHTDCHNVLSTQIVLQPQNNNVSNSSKLTTLLTKTNTVLLFKAPTS